MNLRISIPPLVAASLKHLHPALKRKIKEALHTIGENPYLGKSLQGNLAGLRSFRATHYRIVYQIASHERLIQIVDIGPRKTIYERLFNWR